MGWQMPFKLIFGLRLRGFIMAWLKIFMKYAVMGFVIFLVEFTMADSRYVIRDKKILMKGVSSHPFSQIEIHATWNQQVHIVFNDMDETKLHLFSKGSEKWDSRDKAVPWITLTGMFTEQQRPRLYTIVNEPTSDKKRFKILISVYEIDEAKIDLEKPATTITIPADKIFSNERSKKGEKLLPSSEDGHYLLLGTCDQAKWDPFAVIGTVISGGHAGFANWPFLAEIEDVNEITYRKWPINYGTNAVARISQAVLVENKYHFVGTWYKEYMSSHERIEYSFFDLKSQKWSKPEEIYEEKGNYSSPHGKPAIQANDEDIVIAWSLGNDDHLGSGLFARYKFNGTWSDTEKISSFYASPILAQDRNPILARDRDDNICAFWCEDGKEIFMSSFINRKWSEPCVIVNDERIVTINVPWSIQFDNKGNLHVAYLRQSMDTINSTKLDLIYCDLNVN